MYEPVASASEEAEEESRVEERRESTDWYGTFRPGIYKHCKSKSLGAS